MPPTKDIPARLPVSNATWDAAAMLAKAAAGAYPAAKSRRPSREVPGLTEAEAEIAYWRERCGLGADLSEQIARDLAARHQQEAALGDRAAAEHADDASDLDARFLALRPMQQRSLIHSYLVSTQPADAARAAQLCALTGRDVAKERAAAEQAWSMRAEKSMARLRGQGKRDEAHHSEAGGLWAE